MANRKTAEQKLTSKTCKQITAIAYGYLNDTLTPALKRELQRHLRVCPDCVAFFNTYKKTVAVAKAVQIDDLPANVRDNILAFLRKRMGRIGFYVLITVSELLATVLCW